MIIKSGILEISFEAPSQVLSSINEKKLEKYLDYLAYAMNAKLKKPDDIGSAIAEREITSVFINVNLCGDTKIKELNKEYRGKDKITDVLSFPLNEDLRDIDNFPFLGVDELHLGDIFICNSVTKKQAEEFKLSYEEELVHLAAHGFLHLLGYDHEISDEEEEIMEAEEKWMMEKMTKKKGAN